MLTAAGIGSGLDIESMITQLMAFESRPLIRLEAQKEDVRLSISANGQLRSAIGRFQSALDALADSDSLGGLSASSSDESVLTVSANAGADTQPHDIIVTQLATAHRLSSNVYADATTAIGTGTFDVTVDGNTLSLTLDGSNNTLEQIRDAINSAEDNPGVSASVLTVDDGAYLLLTADETGTANAISVVATNDDPFALPGTGLDAFTTSQLGTLQDALISVDGFDVTSGINTVTGAISGVTMTLQAAGTATVSFEGDSSLLADAAQEFVDSYNFLRGNVKALSANALAGDSLLLGLERSINARLSAVIDMPDSATGFLFESGISFDDTGDLSFNAATLSESVIADPTRILTLFGDSSSLTGDLSTFLQGYLDEDGIIEARIDSLESRDRVLDDQVERTVFRLDQTEERMRAQFTALDVLLSRLTVTSDFLSQQLENLPSISNNRR